MIIILVSTNTTITFTTVALMWCLSALLENVIYDSDII